MTSRYALFTCHLSVTGIYTFVFLELANEHGGERERALRVRPHPMDALPSPPALARWQMTVSPGGRAGGRRPGVAWGMRVVWGGWGCSRWCSLGRRGFEPRLRARTCACARAHTFTAGVFTAVTAVTAVTTVTTVSPTIPKLALHYRGVVTASLVRRLPAPRYLYYAEHSETCTWTLRV